MKKQMGAGRWVSVSRIALVSLIGGAAAGCSSDTMRFAEPFANPFSSSARVAASEPQPAAPTTVAAMPTAPVQSQALPPVQTQPVAPVQTSRVASASAPVTSSGGGWTAEGGTSITVGANDNLNAISQRYGIPTSAILAANGLSNASQVGPGRQIVIPVYSASAQPTQVASARAPAPSRPAGQTKFRLVDSSKAAAQPVEPAPRAQPAVLASAHKVEKPAAAAPVRTASAEPVAPIASAPQAATAPKAPEPQKVAARVEPQVAKPAVQPVPQPEAAKAPVQEPEQTASLAGPSTDFRWPARGRVIAGFGANGGNEGINIAVPEGTPVKAAEAGTVTYSGSEVKGYGNLVLIRHDNGYISAYAHNGELSVKRGERVKRGQVIATSGQTGNVTSPQLHFELRKGQAPVDPMPYLSN
jgi:murein DD-endopeptidase MepM/ murein hydrolase activator NlpD